MAISYAKQEQLKADFAAAINRASVEDDSNTPDHILAAYLVRCLEAYGVAVINRDDWYGERMRPGRTADSAAEARVAELEADAARYRWLRGKVCIIGTPHLSYQKAIFEFVNLPYPPRVAHDPSAELDAAIDAARLSGNKGGSRDG